MVDSMQFFCRFFLLLLLLLFIHSIENSIIWCRHTGLQRSQKRAWKTYTQTTTRTFRLHIKIASHSGISASVLRHARTHARTHSSIKRKRDRNWYIRYRCITKDCALVNNTKQLDVYLYAKWLTTVCHVDIFCCNFLAFFFVRLLHKSWVEHIWPRVFFSFFLSLLVCDEMSLLLLLLAACRLA